jgi:hypothetical protein
VAESIDILKQKYDHVEILKERDKKIVEVHVEFPCVPAMFFMIGEMRG